MAQSTLRGPQDGRVFSKLVQTGSSRRCPGGGRHGVRRLQRRLAPRGSLASGALGGRGRPLRGQDRGCGRLPGRRLELGARRAVRPCTPELDTPSRPAARRQPSDGRRRRRSPLRARRLCEPRAPARRLRARPRALAASAGPSAGAGGRGCRIRRREALRRRGCRPFPDARRRRVRLQPPNRALVEHSRPDAARAPRRRLARRSHLRRRRPHLRLRHEPRRGRGVPALPSAAGGAALDPRSPRRNRARGG